MPKPPKPLKSPTLPSQRTTAPSPTKATQILRDGTVRGQPLTKPQQGFFGAVAALAKKGTRAR